MAGWTWYLLGGWCLAAGGLGLVLLFVLGRRVLVRRAPRCVRCGYGLEGIGDGPCPECGRLPGRPGEAYTLGRRRWVGLLGLVLLAGGLVLPSVPAVRGQGWLNALPLGAQARLLPYSDDPRLWMRVGVAVSNGELSPEVSESVRAKVLERLLDPGRDPTLAAKIFDCFNPGWGSSAFPFAREDLWRVASDGASPAIRSVAARFLGVDQVPTREEASIRRRVWAEATPREQDGLLTAIAVTPVDDEDRELVRAAFESDPWRVGMGVSDDVRDGAEWLRGMLAEELAHPDAGVRRGGLQGFQRWMNDRDSKPPLDVQRRILAMAAGDPDPGVAGDAARMIDDMSAEMGEAIGNALVAAHDRGRFEDILHGVVRRDDEAMLEPLRLIATDPSRALWQRLAAGEAYEHVRPRVRRAWSDPGFASLYAEVVDALLAGDPRVLLRAGAESWFGRSPDFLLAVGARAEADGCEPGGLEAWLAGRDGLAAALEAAEPAAGSPGRALDLLLGESLDEERPGVNDRLRAMHERWFPGHRREGDGGDPDA